MTTRVVVRVGDHELHGVVRAGEPWLAAARRTSGSLAAEPVPVDLSGESLVFAVDPEIRVEVRAMTQDDLDAVVAWRSDRVVQQWWSPGEIRSDDEIAVRYAERIDGRSPTRMWVVEADGNAVGFVQDYRIADYPDYAALAEGVRPGAIGVDYALGDPAWRGRGLGVRLLWAWALRARARFPDAVTFFAAPDHRNAASLRILAKAGFQPGVTFEEPAADGEIATVVGCSLHVATRAGQRRGRSPWRAGVLHAEFAAEVRGPRACIARRRCDGVQASFEHRQRCEVRAWAAEYRANSARRPLG